MKATLLAYAIVFLSAPAGLLFGWLHELSVWADEQYDKCASKVQP